MWRTYSGGGCGGMCGGDVCGGSGGRDRVGINEWVEVKVSDII